LQTNGNDWINLTVKFSSSCKSCGKKISKGELALWSRSSKSIKHVECHTIDLSNPAYVAINSKIAIERLFHNYAFVRNAMMIKRPWKIIMMLSTLLLLAKNHDIFDFVRIVNDVHYY
jgi:hypothetical protein